VFSGFDGAEQGLSPFTRDDASHIAFYVQEDNNGGASSVSIIAVTELDLTPPTVLSADVDDAAPDVVSVQISEALDASAMTGASDWNFAGFIVLDATIVGGDQVNLTLDGPVLATDDLSAALSYTGNLFDDRGNALAGFAGFNVTNNVSPAATNDFSDDFNRANAPDLGPNWVNEIAGWTVSGNAAVSTANARATASTPASSADMEVAFSYSSLTSDIAVSCRFDTFSTFVRFRIRTNRLDVVQRNGGVWGQELRTDGYTPPTSGTLRCRLVGQSFEMFMDDVPVHSGTIPEAAISNPTGNVQLFGGSGATVDDFSLGPA